MRYRWFLYFTKKAVLQRTQRTVLMIIAVSMAVGLLVSMMVLGTGMRKRLSEELRAYGANAIMTSSEYIDEGMIGVLKNKKGIEEVLPELYGRVCLSGKLMLNAIGMPVEGMKDLRLTGRLPSKTEVLIGRRLKEAGDLKTEEEIGLSVECGSSEKRFIIAGIFERVGPEDSAILMDIRELQEFLGFRGKVSVVMLRVNPERFELTLEELSKEFPEFDIKPIRQVALSEEGLLRKIETLMLIVTIIVVMASAITVAGIMAANVFERLTDIGIMKTLGARALQIQLFFIVEAFAVGLVASAAGLFMGLLSAEAISLSAFQRTAPFSFASLPLAFIAGILISILSAIPPVRKISKCRPSIILRGGL